MTRYYLLQTDDRYLRHMLVTVLSVRKHAPRDEESVFYVIDDRISKENKTFAEDFARRYSCRIRFFDGAALSAYLAEQNVPRWRGGYTTYLKLLALSRIAGCERVLYLDSDVIVKNDISTVFSALDESDAPLAMAEDMTVSFLPDYKRYVLGAGGEERVYYNAGVILFDLPRWRAARCEERVLSFVRENTKPLMFCEQDILNILFGMQTHTLSNFYNFCTPLLFYRPRMMGKLFGWDGAHEREYAALSEHYGVGHCFGVLGSRPWHKRSRHPLASDYRALYGEIFGEDFEGLPLSLSWRDYAQIALYYLCRPLYAPLHRRAMERHYGSFIQNARSREKQ